MELNFFECEVHVHEAVQPILDCGEDIACELCEEEESDVTILLPEGMELTPDLEEALQSLTDDFIERLYELYEAHGYVESDEDDCCGCQGAEVTE